MTMLPTWNRRIPLNAAGTRPAATHLATGVLLLATGVFLTVYGVLLAVLPSVTDIAAAHPVAGSLVAAAGLVTALVGVFILDEQRRRAAARALSARRAARRPEIRVRRFDGFRPESHERMASLVGARMDADDLHYVMYCAGHRKVFAVDLLEDGRVGASDVAGRRTAYDDSGARIERALDGFVGTFASPHSGQLERLVLDGEDATLFFQVVDRQAGRYLVAATVVRDRVRTTDAKLALLADDLREELGVQR
ncbi:hypothetical protein [Hamadaea tsunoensis]|uniref:hypothetical protein n=1 Tax=Hamadaea tsunoensis TaxID=53368 RepID=UPI0004849841|nr:hypothetical protein [Hamadaea tsunoensis]